jgi:hypothetical protein
VSDFRGMDRRKRQRRELKDTFNNILYRSKRKIQASLDKMFLKPMIRKSDSLKGIR